MNFLIVSQMKSLSPFYILVLTLLFEAPRDGSQQRALDHFRTRQISSNLFFTFRPNFEGGRVSASFQMRLGFSQFWDTAGFLWDLGCGQVPAGFGIRPNSNPMVVQQQSNSNQYIHIYIYICIYVYILPNSGSSCNRAYYIYIYI